VQAEARSARRTAASRVEKTQIALVLAIVAWGALSFGAVYPWGYAPLGGASALAGALGLLAGQRRRVPRLVVAAGAVVIGSIVVQLVPLSSSVLARLSPATVALLDRYDVMFALARGSAVHTLSVDSRRTWIGVMLIASLGTFWLGLTAMLRTRLVLWIVRGLVIVGTGIAVIGVIAPSGHDARIYGFWQPQSAATSFGPFVNRNHYAGWMLMTIPLGVSYLWSLLARDTAARSWRARLSWLSTPSASGLILLGVALAVMVLSVVMSLSRSGIGCLVVSLTLLVCVVDRTRVSWWRRAILATCVAGVVAACIGWTGTDRIGGRFAESQTDRLGGRVGVWRDASAVARAFPLTGTGFNTFSVAMLFYQTHDLEEFYAEAHSDYLQVGAEGGLLVGIPALALMLVTAREVRRRFSGDDPRSYSLRLGAVAGLLAIALQETIEFSLQMPGNAALFCVLAAIALYHPDRHGAGSLQLRPAA